VVSRTSRSADLVCRIGGEEFAIVLGGASDAVVAGERARKSVEDLHLPHERSGKGIVTISVGVATAVPVGADAAQDLVERADAALYRAKSNGRNQVFVAR
jgi:diguanylate cyclase (GGDEF)-like protein